MGSKGESVVETMNCKGCGKDKPIGEMFVRGGRPIRTCRICRALQMGGSQKRVAKLADTVTKRAKADKGLALDAAKKTLRVAIDPGFGIEGEVDERGYLQLHQRDVEGKIVDTVCLSRAEFLQVSQTFAPWATAA
jgi:hypothetical protein